jgi:pyrroline-5-carboxylate reductase
MTASENIKISFLGGGNMASAMISGLIQQGFLPNNLLAIDPLPTARTFLSDQFNIRTATDVSQCENFLEVSQLIILCVKPQQLSEAITQLNVSLAHLSGPQILTLSIVAGVRIADIAKKLGHSRIVRAMPNTPALIQKGITGLYAGQHVNQQDIQLINLVCQSIGTSLWVNQEVLLDAVTAISGSGPAYVFSMIEHLTNSGIQLGLTAEQAKLFATQTVIGAGQLALSSKDSASQLREKVTSKGGTTFAALEILNQQSWGLALENAVKAATQRAKEMGDEFSKK